MLRRLALFALLAWSAAAQALFDDDEARRRIEDLRRQVQATEQAIVDRLAKVEDRGALVDLAGQIEGLRGELARMRGQLEVVQNQLDNADRRQKDLYVDIDARLRKLEQARDQSTANDKPAVDPAAQAAETRAYEAALNQFKLGNYQLAISAFQGFLVTHPQSNLAPNAQYWIGNAHSAQGQHKQAIAMQQKLLATWPEDAKAPDAMLSIATSQDALGDRRGAQRTLETLLATYPASPAAASAKQRLAQGSRR
ncbi:MAG: tol-pal system protein YbgF [Betaproteobacteria bacterium]|nr:MAG: tol-pal system protein YbgF [Betaproteobacteria bacterium]